MILGRKELEFYFKGINKDSIPNEEALDNQINELLKRNIISGPNEFGDYNVNREELDAYSESLKTSRSVSERVFSLLTLDEVKMVFEKYPEIKNEVYNSVWLYAKEMIELDEYLSEYKPEVTYTGVSVKLPDSPDIDTLLSLKDNLSEILEDDLYQKIRRLENDYLSDKQSLIEKSYEDWIVENKNDDTYWRRENVDLSDLDDKYKDDITLLLDEISEFVNDYANGLFTDYTDEYAMACEVKNSQNFDNYVFTGILEVENRDSDLEEVRD